MIKHGVDFLGVSKAFCSKPILRNASFSFFPGDVIGISGNNGSGKTTIVKMLCGLIQPDSGTITVNSFNIEFNRCRVMQYMGVLFDGSRNLYWRLSAWENYKYFSGLKGVFGNVVSARGYELLQAFGLWGVRHHVVESLSAGMKQRLSICCALCNNPNIIILDEPTSFLDDYSKNCLNKLIGEFSREQKTVIITSHESEVFKKICTRRIAISNAMLIESFR